MNETTHARYERMLKTLKHVASNIESFDESIYTFANEFREFAQSTNDAQLLKMHETLCIMIELYEIE